MQVDDVVEKIRKMGGSKVKFIILYGSVSKNLQTPRSDIDISVYYDADKTQRIHFRMKILGRIPKRYDVTTFQDLPLYVKKEVIHGKILYSSDDVFLYEINRRTYQDFEAFKHRFYDYIKGGVIT